MTVSELAPPAERRPWGRFELPEGAVGHWTIGPMHLWVEHRDGDWLLAWRSSDDPLSPDLEVDVPSADGGPPADVPRIRVASQRTEDALELLPALADRPVVVRPLTRLRLLASDETRIYLSTQAWVRVVGPAGDRELLDQPTLRPSDTWFGPSEREGELCYASRTNAHRDLAALTPLPARVRTWVRLVNNGPRALDVERFSLPAPHLSLYQGEDGTLWTNGVTVRSRGDEGFAEARFEAGPPDECRGARLAAPPRIGLERNVLKRALGALLG